MPTPTWLNALVGGIFGVASLACGGQPSATQTAPSSGAPSALPVPSASVAPSPSASARAPLAGDATPPSDARFDFTKLAAVDAALLPTGPCGGFEAKALDKTASSLLADRLTIRAFDGLVSRERPVDIMEAAKASQAETRLMAKDGSNVFVVFSTELLRNPGGTFVDAMRARDPGVADTVAGRLTFGALEILAFVPKQLTAVGDKATALTAYVVTPSPENVVIRIVFAVSPEVVAAGAGCSRLARDLLATLVPGKRTLDLAGGKRDLGGVSIEVPPQFAVYEQPGIDFTLWHAFEVSPFDQPTGSFHVYLGDHPERIPEGTIPGTLLGRDILWAEESSPEILSRQAIVAAPKGGVVHIFFGAESTRLFEAFLKMAESLKP